jgi:hypothetical protein
MEREKLASLFISRAQSSTELSQISCAKEVIFFKKFPFFFKNLIHGPV